VGVGGRGGDLVDGSLRFVEAIEHLLELGAGGVFFELQLDLLEAAVPAEDARADAPAIERGNDATERNGDGDDGNEDDPEPVDEVCSPERKVTLQEWDAVLLVVHRLAAEREASLAGRWELAHLVEHARRAVLLVSC